MKEQEVKTILLSGVGGQGTILLSRILTEGFVEAGYDVKMSEIHGMAQRGGSVSTQIRYGKTVYSPIIGPGGADVLLAFEKMEAVRYAGFLKPEGLAIINNYEIMPLPVASGRAEYPEGLLEAMESRFKVYSLDAMSAARKLGNSKVMNLVLFGAMVEVLRLDEADWPKVIARTVPERFRELNLAAFAAGRQLMNGTGGQD